MLHGHISRAGLIFQVIRASFLPPSFPSQTDLKRRDRIGGQQQQQQHRTIVFAKRAIATL